MAFVSQGDFLRQTAARVRALRLGAGLTQADLADRARIALATYRLFERTGRIALDRLYRLAAVLGRVGELAELFRPEPFQDLSQIEPPAPRQRGRRRPPHPES